MAKTSTLPNPTNNNSKNKQTHKTKKTNLPSQTKEPQPPQPQQLPSWAIMKNILTCKHLEVVSHQNQQQQQTKKHKQKPNNKKIKKMKCSGSLCNNTKVMHRPEPPSPDKGRNRSGASYVQRVTLGTTNANNKSNTSSTSNRNNKSGASYVQRVSVGTTNNVNKSLSTNSTNNSNSSYGVKGMGLRRLTGCYECRMIVDPVLAFTRDPSMRATICSCPHCGQLFMKPDILELHQAVRHAVSELGGDDTSKNIVEIIFQSSWLMKQNPVCKIDRILKVHNTQKTINRFEEYRDLIKFKANNLPKKHPRCIADGNELLRFYCTTFKCSLGLNGSSNLCNSIPLCNICSIIKNGFKLSGGDEIGPAKKGISGDDANGPAQNGILTTASSGRAHEKARVGPDENDKRAMLVCRVIAGRVKKPVEGGATSGLVSSEECDSVAGATGVYSNLDELYVFNTKAILPCFVVIYRC